MSSYGISAVERVGDAVEEPVEALLGEHLVEHVREPLVRLDGRAASESGLGRPSTRGDQAYGWGSRRLDGRRVGHDGKRLPLSSSDAARARLTPVLRRSAVVGTVEDARVALLSRLIDHAALFPPASLPLPEALEEDRRARESNAAFVLGRFVCPASRLAELPDVGRGVSVTLDEAAVPADIDARVEAVETRMPHELETLASAAPEVYVEIPVGDGVEPSLDALRAARLGPRSAAGAHRCRAQRSWQRSSVAAASGHSSSRRLPGSTTQCGAMASMGS